MENTDHESTALELDNTAKPIPIERFKGYYVNPNGVVYNRDGQVVAQYSIGNTMSVCLYDAKDHSSTTSTVARLVAVTFLPLPEGYTADDLDHNYVIKVNHKDNNARNNNVNNLEWYAYTLPQQWRNNMSKSAIGNQRAKGHVAGHSKYRYVYEYKGVDYSDVNDLARVLRCTKSGITESFRRNASIVQRGILKRFKIHVLDLTTGTPYDTPTDAAKALGIVNPSSVTNVAKHGGTVRDHTGVKHEFAYIYFKGNKMYSL